ncbi:MAG: RelA/SpoT family protein, partial [Mollicutes bacterium]|nr:RelA/SpoT family protein [Mollicutes bacterium]
SLQSGPVTICSAFLHDVVEDTEVTIEDINRFFGQEVGRIVDALTKIQRLKLSRNTQEEFEAEDHRKIFLGMAKDLRVIIIKLADRLHNLRTIEALKPERQHALAKETLEVFAPIAHRLGIYKIESELEDLSLKIEHPVEYQNILDNLNKNIKNRSKALNSLKKKIADILISANFKIEIESRVKSIFSIYKKMYQKGHKFEQIYDVLAIRIIAETEINCYEILGLIHSNFKPIPGRFKDYIAMPKPNMYQSLHTTIMSGDGNIFEVQIRTHEMDEVAESGVAAHWRYKENSHYNAKQEQREIEEQLHWFRDFVSISTENQDKSAKDYMESLTKDIFEANVYVFTPKGKVIDLPSGSTPIDLAFKIHTKLGLSITGAMVNNNLVPLSTQLKTGDVVEIKTSNNAPGPNENWLNLVKTNTAKTNIKKFLIKRNESLLREDRINKGRQSCLDFFKDRGAEEKEAIDLISTNNVLNNYHCKTLDDLFIAIASHNPNPSQIADFIGFKRKEIDNAVNLSKKENFDNDNCPVTVDNESGLKITLGNCCTPIPGDRIIGYVTKGMGITVHRCDCPNISNVTKRLIDVHWKQNLKSKSYPVDLLIECSDRDNLIVDIMSVLGSLRIKCTEISAKLHSETFSCSVSCQVYCEDLNELEKVFVALKNIRSVNEIKRVFH